MAPQCKRPVAALFFRLSLLATLLAGTSPVSGTDKGGGNAKASGDLRKLEGSWTTPSGGGEGEVVYTFKGDKLTVKAPSRAYEITVKLDESAKPHKTIDMKIDKSPDDAQGQTSKGIYRLEGEDKLVLCFRPSDERPDKFEQVGFEQFLVELTRKKDKGEKK